MKFKENKINNGNVNEIDHKLYKVAMILYHLSVPHTYYIKYFIFLYHKSI